MLKSIPQRSDSFRWSLSPLFASATLTTIFDEVLVPEDERSMFTKEQHDTNELAALRTAFGSGLEGEGQGFMGMCCDVSI